MAALRAMHPAPLAVEPGRGDGIRHGEYKRALFRYVMTILRNGKIREVKLLMY